MNEEWITRSTAEASTLDIVWAAHDVLAEADASQGARGPLRTAEAHEAAAHVELWLRHIAWDFSAIDDLASRAPDGDRSSPAHFDARDRARESALWNERGIAVRSYVTLGKRPCAFTGTVRPWDFLDPRTYPDLKENGGNRGTDLLFRACYRACAGGPFTPPALAGTRVSYLAPADEALIEEWTDRKVLVWDNDGIVNTASMVWRPNQDVVLVPADHMDIVGHYQLEPADGDDGRCYQAYDLLRVSVRRTHLRARVDRRARLVDRRKKPGPDRPGGPGDPRRAAERSRVLGRVSPQRHPDGVHACEATGGRNRLRMRDARPRPTCAMLRPMG